MTNNPFIFSLLILISFSIFLTQLIFSARSQLPLYENNIDPGYEYLINGLNIVYFKLPGHLDHPGFPLQILISLIISSIFLVKSNFYFLSDFDLKKDFVINSEFYALSTISTLIFIQIATVIFVCFVLNRYFRTPIIGLFPLLLCLNPEMTKFITTIRPESLIFSLTNILISLFIIYNHSNSRKTKNILSYFMGVLVAIGILTKIIFAPFLLLFIFLKKFRFKFLFAFLSTFILFLIPLRSNISPEWFINIILQRGRHGDSLPTKNFSELLSDILELNNSVTPLFISTFLCFLIISFFHKRIDPKLLKIVFFNFFFIAIFSLLNFKDAYPQDFVSLISLCGIFIILSLILLYNYLNINLNFISIFFFNLIFLIFFVRIVFSVLESSSYTKRLISVEDSSIYRTSVADSNTFIVSSFKVPTKFSALLFGNFYYGPGIIDDELFSKYPRNIEFNIWDNYFYSSQGEKLSCTYLNNLLNNFNRIYLVSNSPIQFIEKASVGGYDIKLGNQNKIGEVWSILDIQSIDCKVKE